MSENNPSTQIWIDADACPGEAKKLLFRAADRRQVRLTLVANQPMRTPTSTLITSVLVTAGVDAADQYIIRHVGTGDLVITADIPLAAEVVAKGAEALNPRGDLYTEANIGERLAARHLLDELRQSGLVTGGPASYSVKRPSSLCPINSIVGSPEPNRQELKCNSLPPTLPSGSRSWFF